MEGGIFRSNLRNFAIPTIDQMAGPLDDWAVHVDTNAPGNRKCRSGSSQADEDSGPISIRRIPLGRLAQLVRAPR